MHINLDPNAPPPPWTEFVDWLATLDGFELAYVQTILELLENAVKDEVMNLAD